MKLTTSLSWYMYILISPNLSSWIHMPATTVWEKFYLRFMMRLSAMIAECSERRSVTTVLLEGSYWQLWYSQTSSVLICWANHLVSEHTMAHFCGYTTSRNHRANLQGGFRNSKSLNMRSYIKKVTVIAMQILSLILLATSTNAMYMS